MVDFKTDNVKPGSEEKEANKHVDQLRAYSLMIANALSPEVEGQVYFTGPGKNVEIGVVAGFEDGLHTRIREWKNRI